MILIVKWGEVPCEEQPPIFFRDDLDVGFCVEDVRDKSSRGIVDMSILRVVKDISCEEIGRNVFSGG